MFYCLSWKTINFCFRILIAYHLSLILVSAELIKKVLTLYKLTTKDNTVPHHSEILFCCKMTTSEEVRFVMLTLWTSLARKNYLGIWSSSKHLMQFDFKFHATFCLMLMLIGQFKSDKHRLIYFWDEPHTSMRKVDFML